MKQVLHHPLTQNFRCINIILAKVSWNLYDTWKIKHTTELLYYNEIIPFSLGENSRKSYVTNLKWISMTFPFDTNIASIFSVSISLIDIVCTWTARNICSFNIDDIDDICSVINKFAIHIHYIDSSVLLFVQIILTNFIFS